MIGRTSVGSSSCGRTGLVGACCGLDAEFDEGIGLFCISVLSKLKHKLYILMVTITWERKHSCRIHN